MNVNQILKPVFEQRPELRGTIDAKVLATAVESLGDVQGAELIRTTTTDQIEQAFKSWYQEVRAMTVAGAQAVAVNKDSSIGATTQTASFHQVTLPNWSASSRKAAEKKLSDDARLAISQHPEQSHALVFEVADATRVQELLRDHGLESQARVGTGLQSNRLFLESGGEAALSLAKDSRVGRVFLATPPDRVNHQLSLVAREAARIARMKGNVCHWPEQVPGGRELWSIFRRVMGESGRTVAMGPDAYSGTVYHTDQQVNELLGAVEHARYRLHELLRQRGSYSVDAPSLGADLAGKLARAIIESVTLTA